MDSVGDHLLARPRLTEEEDGAREGSHLVDHVHDLLEAEVRAYDFFADLLAKLGLQVAVVVHQQIPQPQDLPVAQVVAQGDGEGIAGRRTRF